MYVSAGRAIARCLTFAGAALALAPGASAQTADNVAVIINDASHASREVGQYYAQKRGIPATNIIHVTTAVTDEITRAEFLTTIQTPVAAALLMKQLQDRILYLVLTQDMPLRIAGSGGAEGTVSSVDSELTLLYRRMTGTTILTRGPVENPYFAAGGVSNAERFSRRAHDIYLVSRLAGFTVDDARALVDRGAAPGREGSVVLDQRVPLVHHTGETWLEAAAAQLSAAGHGARVALESTPKPARSTLPVLGYYSWGSTDPALRLRDIGITFGPGALAASFVSSDARTLSAPPAGWQPTNDHANAAAWFRGSAQSLVGDVIRAGVTGAAGQVAEPFLGSAVRPQILFDAYLAGFNLVESYYLAMPHLSWQTVVFGDPLCQPFARASVDTHDIDGGVDEDTTLPAFYAARRLAVAMAQAPGATIEALRLALRSEAGVASGNFSAAREALEASTAVDGKVVGVQFQLAVLYERNGEFDRAIERYRTILALQPNHAVSLNNLAYLLATHARAAAEALPLAERAVALAPTDGAVFDTLGWTHYLLGDAASAAGVLADAIRLAPGNADIHLHGAIAFESNGQRGDAIAALDRAVRLNPSIAAREDARRLRMRLAASPE